MLLGQVHRVVQQAHDLDNLTDLSIDHEMPRARDPPNRKTHIVAARAQVQRSQIGRKVGVDLWHYEATSGGSIRKALDYLAPYTTAANRWPYQDISAIEPDLLLLPLRMGELVYGDARYRALIAQIPPEIARTSRVQILFVD